MTHIACPVALHPDGGQRRIAVYEAPGGERKLVTAPASTPAEAAHAAAHVLFDTSTLETRAALPIGTSADIEPNETWHFALCRVVPPVREQWKHLCPKSALLLQFSWMPLDAPLTGFSTPDARALDWIRAAL